MSVNAHFTYPADGKLPDANGEPDDENPMIFNFEGDDDVWVFIDGVLVLDLGGVHSPVKGSINFATGVVTVAEFDSKGNYSYTNNTTIQEMFQAAGKSWNPEAYSDHAFDFFYLERGGCDSNCRLSFNLLTRPEEEAKGDLEFDKTDEKSAPLEGARFQLFTNEQCTTALTWMVEEEETVRTAVAISTADASGNVRFREIPSGNYYMKEIEAPEGYALSDRVYRVHIASGGGKSSVKYNGQILHQIVNHRMKLTLKKVDDQGNPLNGAKFSLSRIEETGAVETREVEITDSDGQYTLNHLKPGNYVLTETEAPYGYTGLGDETIAFTVTESGIILGTHPAGVTYDGGELTLTIPNAPILDGNIRVIKKWVDQNGNAVSGGNNTATVQLRRYRYEKNGGSSEAKNVKVELVFPEQKGIWVDGKCCDRYIPEKIVLSGLIDGTSAVIKVTNPDWADFYREENRTQAVDKFNENGINYFSADVDFSDTDTVTFYCKGEWHWDKTYTCSFNTSTEEPKVELVSDDFFPSPTDEKATQILSSTNNFAHTWTIGDAPGCDFPASDGSHPYLYDLVELKPDGTEVPIGGEVQEDMILKSITCDPEKTEHTGIAQGVITVINEITVSETTAVTLKKVDQSDIGKDTAVLLRGASFTITKYTDRQYQVKDTSWGDGGSRTLTDEKNGDAYTLNGCFTFTELPAGYYQVEETVSPAGYVQLAGNPRFEVGGDLRVYLLDENAERLDGNAEEMLRVLPVTEEQTGNVVMIGNTPGAALPATGGCGTRGFCLFGTCLTAMAGSVLVIRRKNRESAAVFHV